ncbi:hypothetical protein [Pseudomonas sp. GM48]|uniref:hypothetical protein n=1 Tax=Pseudomonas sp. GM48 TaxID=1144330 RepID=UPI0002704A16|nr:hypothetical protein [Pseudomonas sp. GM48]EJM58100.1 hypothetical protein PMI28_02465 [Pseudomonas sp. GM48]
MANLQEDPRPLVDIRPPNVNSPLSGQVYSSPVTIDIIPGEGGHYRAKNFKIHVHYNGPWIESRDVDSGPFTQAMDPGPHELHTQAKWFNDKDKDESDWVFIKYFYVLTPPKTL